ncbi:hypothetical protein TNIN_409381 [Trichonephila inaurata madagascariensis]|uniref:Uncharacterized protein n=1 Tax=Trichonephila inaurata madagascariensis TaxID=2747483 RepID=A0A8X6X0D7_9ARAC|nr:hypothetical protein TNIN_409381 [Trichonephila inaurata madagascariensis]
MWKKGRGEKKRKGGKKDEENEKDENKNYAFYSFRRVNFIHFGSSCKNTLPDFSVEISDNKSFEKWHEEKVIHP